MKPLYYYLSILLLFISCKEEKEETISNYFSSERIAETNDIDSLNQILKNATAVADYEAAYLSQRRKYEILHRDVSEKRYKEMLDSLSSFAEKTKNKKKIAESTYKYGRYFRLQFKLDSAYIYYDKAKNHYLELNDSLELAKSYLSLGKILYHEYDNLSAQELTIQGLNYLPEGTKDVYYISSYNVLGYSSLNLGRYEQAIYWFEQAVAVAPKSKYAQQVKINLVKAYLSIKNYKKSIAVGKQLLQLETYQNKTESRARILTHLGRSYTDTGERNMALSALLEAKEIREEKDSYNLDNTYFALAHFYKDSDPKKAKTYIDKCNFPDNKVQLKLKAYKLLQKIPELPNKIQYYEEYINFSDSLNKAILNKTDKYAQIRYQGQRDKEKILTLKKETAQQQLEIERQKYTNLIVGFIIVIMVLLTVAFYIIMFNRHKKNKEIAIYNTENKLSKRVHDEVANDVYQLMNQLEHLDDFSKKQLLDNLESIYDQTRNISRSVSSAEILADFNKKLEDLIYSYQNENSSIVLKNLEPKVFETISNKIKLNLYRIIQELLTNMKKHSEADLVFIRFQRSENKLFFIYRDNGQGCEEDNIIENGLKHIKQRIKESDGKINIENLESGGLQVKISFILE